MDIPVLTSYFRAKESHIKRCLRTTSKKHRVSEKQVYDIILAGLVSLEDTPYEVYFKIVEHLPVKEILKLCGTSRRFREFCDDQRLWSYLLKRDFGVKLPKSNEKDSKKRYIELYQQPTAHLSCGNFYTGAITTKGLFMWGKNDFGQLGDSTTETRSTPTFIDIPGKPFWVSCGGFHTGVITTEGLFMWGSNGDGQLGDSTTENRLVPTKIKIPGKPLQVSCGTSFTGAITTEGLFMWGENSDGQLGDSTMENKLVPTKIEIPGKPLQVSCGIDSTGVITTKGLFMWGENSDGYLGKNECLTPTRIKIPGKPLQISHSLSHIGVITSKGLYMWGWGYEGQLGSGRGIRRNRINPTQTKIYGNPLRVSCGNEFTGAITTEGLYMWGLNKHGQLGGGVYIVNEFAPERVFVPGKPLQVSCGDNHTGVITSEGLYMWGGNMYGQLGNGEDGIMRSGATNIKVKIPGKFM